ncbi:MAG: hypothetical protein Q7R39_17690, partial [Dehalococcoidia bacterium]|nr:hypothetical protein [Dehalococcoidia bacterium]
MRFSITKVVTTIFMVAVVLFPFPLVGARADSCSLVLGFASLGAMIPDRVGQCVDNESHNPENGDALQHTTGGLLVWRKADNWTAFTEGYRSWVNGPGGLQQRLNTERFSWEANPDGLAMAGAGPVATNAPSSDSDVPAGGISVSRPLRNDLPPFSQSPDPRFGGIQVSDVGVPVAQDLGLSWTRELYLWDLMPQYDPGMFDRISTDQHLGPGLREVGLLMFFALYANGGQGKMVPSAGLDLQWSDPGNRFGQYTRGLASAKKGKVDTWLLYNEQDICGPSEPGFSWDSADRVQDFYNYMKTGYQAIKAGNPGATVLLGSLSLVDSSCQTDGTEMSFWNRWLEIAAADPAAAANQYWFDGLSLNIHKEPEKIYDLIRRYHESMQSHGFDKPVWLVETGIPVLLDTIDPSSNFDLAVNKDNQESFLVQAYANAIAAGADHIGIYKMSDFPPSDSAYRTIKAAVKYMSGVASASKSPENRSAGGRYVDRLNGVVTITMSGPGFQTVVAYNRSATPQPVAIPATSSLAMFSDKAGNERQVAAQGGFYNFT